MWPFWGFIVQVIGAGLVVVMPGNPLIGWFLLALAAIATIGLLGKQVYDERTALKAIGFGASLVSPIAGVFFILYINTKNPTLPVSQPTPSLSVTGQPQNLTTPLRDEATKWRLSKSIHFLTMNPSGDVKGRTCNVLIVHYQLPYAENNATDLKEVFNVVDWKYGNTKRYSRPRPSKRGFQFGLGEEVLRKHVARF